MTADSLSVKLARMAFTELGAEEVIASRCFDATERAASRSIIAFPEDCTLSAASSATEKPRSAGSAGAGSAYVSGTDFSQTETVSDTCCSRPLAVALSGSADKAYATDADNASTAAKAPAKILMRLFIFVPPLSKNPLTPQYVYTISAYMIAYKIRKRKQYQ